MKDIKCIIGFIFLNFFSISSSQVIHGTIFNKDTDEVVAHASIYFSGTFKGTSSNENGFFELDISQYSNRPLTISAIGFNSYTLTGIPEKESIAIYLVPALFKLDEAMVATESLADLRKTYLKIFKSAFLGTSFNAKRCNITNEEDITFNYSSSVDTLKAFARKPLQITNNSLGYQITYHLDKFEYDKNGGTLSFTGDIIFKKDMASGGSKRRTYLRRRKYAYNGSRMQLFRVLWATGIPSPSYTIKDAENKALDFNQVVYQDIDQKKYLSFKEDIFVYYYSDLTVITFLQDRVFFEQDGFFDPAGIQWGGIMSLRRIGDLLPYEYTKVL